MQYDKNAGKAATTARIGLNITCQPGQRLRLTLGLRKSDDRWIVLHEHHSFPDRTPSPEV
jgi:ketosteroid isomerase-like protein